jgi:hypothetical protein
LDGRDPNSLLNILRCFGKFDRPFAERPKWGQIRPTVARPRVRQLRRDAAHRDVMRLTRHPTRLRLVTALRAGDPAPVLDHRLVPLGHCAPARTRAPRTTTLAADRRHMFPVAADRLTALPASDPRLIGSPLVGRPLLMGRSSTLARDLALPRPIHRGEPAVTRSAPGGPRTAVMVLGVASAFYVSAIWHAFLRLNAPELV